MNELYPSTEPQTVKFTEEQIAAAVDFWRRVPEMLTDPKLADIKSGFEELCKDYGVYGRENRSLLREEANRRLVEERINKSREE